MVTRWHPYRDAFNRWRARVQEMGILVLVEEMIWGDCRGLSLWDAGSPAMIVLSSQDAFNGRIFTMFHEYGHLMLRQPGSCLIAVQDQTSKGRVERWCNTFAASFLLPASEFKDQIANLFPKVSRDAWTLWHIERLAAKFRVSPYATARRLKELGITDFYDTRHEELRLFDKRRPPPRREEQTGGLRAEVKKLGEIGVGAAGVFLEALRGQVIDAPEAADALGLRLDQLKGLEEETEAQRSRIHV
jgi:Zn-dependent peptidase ImmA (M78 family)